MNLRRSFIVEICIFLVGLREGLGQGEGRVRNDGLGFEQLDGCDETTAGCSVVELVGLKPQGSRRGRYSRTSRQCEGERENRSVYKQDRGASYMYYLEEDSGWEGWQVGSTACRNRAGVAVQDNATVPEAVTRVWEEYYSNGYWQPNANIKVRCASGFTPWEIIGISIAVIVALSILSSVAMSVYRTYKLKKRQNTRRVLVDGGGLPPPTVYTNDGAILNDEDLPPFVPPGFPPAPPAYDTCIIDAPPAYAEIYNTTNSANTTTSSTDPPPLYDNAPPAESSTTTPEANVNDGEIPAQDSNEMSMSVRNTNTNPLALESGSTQDHVALTIVETPRRGDDDHNHNVHGDDVTQRSRSRSCESRSKSTEPEEAGYEDVESSQVEPVYVDLVDDEEEIPANRRDDEAYENVECDTVINHNDIDIENVYEEIPVVEESNA